MDRPLTVAVLAGGLTHERDISLHSGRRVAAALTNIGIQAKLLDVDGQLLQRLTALEPDVVWPLVHGATGEDGSLQDLLFLAGYPIVGSKGLACRLAADKAVASAVLLRAGLAVPESIALPQSLFREVGVTGVLDLIESRFGFPVVIKPTRAGSSMGLTIVQNKAQLPGAMVDCFAYGEVALIQQFVAGREFGVGVADVGEGAFALPAVEIKASGLYDYDARYNPGRVEYSIVDDGDPESDVVTKLALDVHTALGLRHISRTDMILDNEGIAWFIDVNTSPGMTETSVFPQAASAFAEIEGVELDAVYAAITRTAVAQSLN